MSAMFARCEHGEAAESPSGGCWGEGGREGSSGGNRHPAPDSTTAGQEGEKEK